MDKDFQLLHVRVPVEVYEWVHKSAAENDRSLNGQIVNLLRQAKREDTRPTKLVEHQAEYKPA